MFFTAEIAENVEKMSLLKDFKPSLFFLARFLGIYLLGNILYGVYVESFGDFPDPITHLVSRQTSVTLNGLHEETTAIVNTQGPTVFIQTPERSVLNIFEGCNGVNVMIVFIAFMVAFGGPVKKMLWFIPAGLLIIHLFNILRLVLLYYTDLYYEEWFYYFHKYLFTAILYIVVFILWAVWIMKIVQRKGNAVDDQS